mgnify:CR=1 FL=1
MKIIDEETYLSQHEASRQDIGDAALHKNLQPGRRKDQLIARQAKLDKDLLERREVLRHEYQSKVALGELRPLTRIERLITTANGNPDNQAVLAARRLLEGKNIEWQQQNNGGVDNEI